MLDYLHSHFHLGLPGEIGLIIGLLGLGLFLGNLINNLRLGKSIGDAIAESPGGSVIYDLADRATDLFKILDWIEKINPDFFYDDEETIVETIITALKELKVEIEYQKGKLIYKDILKMYRKDIHIENVKALMEDTTDKQWLKEIAENVLK